MSKKMRAIGARHLGTSVVCAVCGRMQTRSGDVRKHVLETGHDVTVTTTTATTFGLREDLKARLGLVSA